MQMNVQMLSQVILKVMNQIMQLYKDMESDDMQDIDRYMEDTEYLNL